MKLIFFLHRGSLNKIIDYFPSKFLLIHTQYLIHSPQSCLNLLEIVTMFDLADLSHKVEPENINKEKESISIFI